MQLASEDIREFQNIIKEEYGRDLTEGEATALANRLLFLYERLYQPHHMEASTQHDRDPPDPAP